MFVFGKTVEVVHFSETGSIIIHYSQPRKNRHRHLYGINPVPVICFLTLYHRIKGSLYITDTFRFFIYQPAVDIGLSATLIIGIPVMVSITKSPIMFLTPLYSIIV